MVVAHVQTDTLKLGSENGFLKAVEGDVTAIEQLGGGVPVAETVAALRTFTGLSTPQMLFCRGHGAAEDGGGGWFLYRPDSTDAEDGGSVVEPEDGAGRFHRVPDGDPRPEWFGGRPDCNDDGTAGTDNATAIQACLDRYGRCVLGAGVYGVLPAQNQAGSTAYQAISLTGRSGLELAGQSREKSVLRVLAHAGFPEMPEMVYVIRGWGGEGHDQGYRFHDFSIDCNFGRSLTQTKKKLGVSAISTTNMYDLELRDMKFWGYGTGYQPGAAREAFVVTLNVLPNVVAKGNAQCINLDFGPNNDNPGIGPGPELSLLTLSTPDSRIEGCTFHDITRRPNSRNIIHLITPTRTQNLAIVNNSVTNCDGPFIYSDNGYIRNLVVSGNTLSECPNLAYLTNIWAGVGPQYLGQYENLLFADNVVQLGMSETYRAINKEGAPMIGVFIFYRDHAGQQRPHISNLALRDNIFTGTKLETSGGTVWPRLFYAYSDRPGGVLTPNDPPWFWEGLELEGNRVDLPADYADHNKVLGVPDPYDCLWISVWNGSQLDPSQFRVSHNRDRHCRPARLYGNTGGGGGKLKVLKVEPGDELHQPFAEEAPKDGRLYGRRNGEWVVI